MLRARAIKPAVGFLVTGFNQRTAEICRAMRALRTPQFCATDRLVQAAA